MTNFSQKGSVHIISLAILAITGLALVGAIILAKTGTNFGSRAYWPGAHQPLPQTLLGKSCRSNADCESNSQLGRNSGLVLQCLDQTHSLVAEDSGVSGTCQYSDMER